MADSCSVLLTPRCALCFGNANGSPLEKDDDDVEDDDHQRHHQFEPACPALL